MMRFKLLFVFLLFVGLNACQQDDNSVEMGSEVPLCEDCAFSCVAASADEIISNNCGDDRFCEFKVETQSTIDLNLDMGIGIGNKNVFQLRYISQAFVGPELIVIMELDAGQTSFAAEGGELTNMTLHVRRICRCLEVDFVAVNSGCVQGELQADGSWRIQGNLMANYESDDLNVVFDAQFF